MENKNATAADAELILRLYDLRRETEMRKARNWIAGEFWPRSFAEVDRTLMAFDTHESAYFRQVISYWDMACALVLRGSLHSGLFFDTSGEAYFVYAKIKPFIEELRARFSPEFMKCVEQVIEGTPEGRERLRRMEENIAQFAEMRRKSQPQASEVSQAA